MGIDIAQTGICAVQLQVGKSIQLESMNGQWFAEGTIDVDGTIDWNEVEQALAQALSPIALKTKHVCVSIPTEFTVVRQLNLPNFGDAELRSVIEFELTNSIHVPFQKVVFDFIRTKATDVAREDGKIGVLLVAADRTFVDNLLPIFKRRKLSVSTIDLRPLANHRVFEYVGNEMKTFLCIEDEVKSTYVHVYHDGQLYLSRKLPDNPIPLETDADANVGMEIDADHLAKLAAELERTMDFFRYTLMQREAEFDEIVIMGIHPQVQTFANQIADRMGVSTSVFSFRTLIESRAFSVRRGLVPSIDEEHDYTAAIGLAMRGV